MPYLTGYYRFKDTLTTTGWGNYANKSDYVTFISNNKSYEVFSNYVFQYFKFYSPSPPASLEQHISSSQENAEMEENISLSDADAMLLDSQHISDEDQLPSNPEDIPVDDGILAIPLDEVDDDEVISSDPDLDSQDGSDSESEISDQDTQSDIAVDYDD